MHFSVRTGTVLAESRLPLLKWLAIYMLTSARKGIPSTQMARELGVTQKTAWFLAQRIRETWLKDRGSHMDGDQMQVDETYVGGREKNKHAIKKLNAGRGTVGKTAVVGIRSASGEVRAVVVENTKAATLERLVREHCKTGATIVTDTHGGYIGLEAAGFQHIRINHSAGEYIRDMAHTNGIESFWAILKRGYVGIYHYMSAKQVGTMGFINMTIARMAGERPHLQGTDPCLMRRA